MRPTFRIDKSETGIDEIESETAKIAFHGIIFDFVCSAKRSAGDSLDALALWWTYFLIETISITISIGNREEISATESI